MDENNTEGITWVTPCIEYVWTINEKSRTNKYLAKGRRPGEPAHTITYYPANAGA
jgi:hypothetical protein